MVCLCYVNIWEPPNSFQLGAPEFPPLGCSRIPSAWEPPKAKATLSIEIYRYKCLLCLFTQFTNRGFQTTLGCLACGMSIPRSPQAVATYNSLTVGRHARHLQAARDKDRPASQATRDKDWPAEGTNLLCDLENLIESF